MSAFKLYLSGPMTGYPDHNFPAFHRAASVLREQGFIVLSPADEPAGMMSWADYLRRDLAMVCEARGVATLPDWEKSKGANLECHVARELGIEVEPVEFWLNKEAV
jgi:hypothetical protein